MINESKSIRDNLDGLFAISIEANEGEGEDGFCTSITNERALIGVFDGCGGLGAKRYESYGRHTGAYMASRLASGAVYDWFQQNHTLRFDSLSDDIKKRITKALREGSDKSKSSLNIRGSMVRDFPTTAAMVIASCSDQSILLDALWAGDSRIYLLGQAGLEVLSIDDTDSKDAFEDLRNDPVQTNVMSSDGKYTIHHSKWRINEPMTVIVSTDGYFGYWKTPMHFEYFLLNTLKKAGSLEEWERMLRDDIREITGDDSSLAAMMFGFESFSNLKSFYTVRLNELYKYYILPLDEYYSDERARSLWEKYRINYEKHIK